jgi:hypothetical protein
MRRYTSVYLFYPFSTLSHIDQAITLEIQIPQATAFHFAGDNN